MKNKDNFIFGLIVGALLPVASFFGYYYWKFSLFTFKEFIQVLEQNKQLVYRIEHPLSFIEYCTFYIVYQWKKR